MIRIWIKFLTTSLLLLAFSCAESFDSPSQYSNVGFDKGRRADDATNTIPNMHPASPAKVIENADPGYYTDNNMDFTAQSAKEAVTNYRGRQRAAQYPAQYYQAPPQQYYSAPSTPYYQQGYYAQPYTAPNYQPQVVPASRFYSNPYAIPPSNQAPQYYDSDQYYAPPTYYNNSDAPPVSSQQNNRH